MDRGCSCRAKGRLFIHVESRHTNVVRVMITEANNYRDFFTVYLNNGQGEIRIDSISYGKVKIESNIDGEETIYYPGNVILFQKDQYIHKVNIIDRRRR